MRLIKAMMLLQLCLVITGCSNSHTFGPYKGKVIDAETKQPIEGAAVLVVFYADEPGPAGSIGHYADSLETMTDKNGEFRIPEHKVKPEKWRYVLKSGGYFTIFKPGYGCYPNHKDVEPMFVPNGTLPPKESVTVMLPRLKTREERDESLSCGPNLEPPLSKRPRLIRLLNQERRALGYSSFYEEGQ